MESRQHKLKMQSIEHGIDIGIGHLHDDDHPAISSNLSFCAWNINGLSSKYLGNKLQSIDFLSVIDNSDFIVLTEIGNCSDLEIAGYKSFVQCSTPNQSRKGGRNSGGIALFYKNKLHKNISTTKTAQNFLWFKIEKSFLNSVKDIYVCGLYIPPCNSKYFDLEIFDQLEQDSTLFYNRISNSYGGL